MASSSEKSSFSQTCSLLSQYLKERGSFGDLNLGLGMTCNIEANGVPEMPPRPATTTMNLFPITEKSADVSAPNRAAPQNMESMNLFPQQVGFVSTKDTPNMADSRFDKPAAAKDPQTAPMTIFYGRQVIVFNDLPADKAKEIMELASRGSSQSQAAATTFPSMQAQSHNSFAANLSKSLIESTRPVTPNLVKNPTEPSCSVPSSSNAIPNFGNNQIPEHAQPPPRPITCDLPIARRNSLHRFLEKRKDRMVARLPYQVAPNKPAEGKSWLGLASQTPQ